MALAVGTRLGPYEILSAIGAGGMGEVYKARDTRLDRVIAVKILPPSLAGDLHFRERFDREARALSSLSHPHICTLFDVGRQDDHDFLVLEYLEGETLAERLARGGNAGGAALDPAEALKIAIDICDALDKAHSSGIVHRDLKPANVMLTKAGAKLLDFGLAKSAAPVVTPTGLSMLPTTPANLTAHGTILGTFQYMAPEQIEGLEADARTDIFAFGALLFEMLTGRTAFQGKTRASLLGAILKDEPPAVSQVQRAAPATLDRIVATCVAKDPDDRYQSARDLSRDLKWAASGSTKNPTARTIASRVGSNRVAWLVAGLSTLALIATAVIAARRGGAVTTAGPPIQFTIAPPDNTSFGGPPAGGTGTAAQVAVSPDGQNIVFVAGTPAAYKIWLRPIGTLTATPIPGTEGGAFPFWSPDSRFIGFFAAGKLKKVRADGGIPIVLCDAPFGRGGSWNRDNVILFTPSSFGTGLARVSSAGGRPTVVTTLNPATGETSHRWPQFLPDGTHFLYTVTTGICCPPVKPARIRVGSLDASEATSDLLEVESAVSYASGHLLYARDERLMAQRFDPDARRTNGDAFPVVEHVGTEGSRYMSASASQSGALVYAQGLSETTQQLTWFDREGNALGTVGEGAPYINLSLSPDESRVVVARRTDSSDNLDIHIIDVARNVTSRLTTDPGLEASPIWSPDGTSVVFEAQRAEKRSLRRKSINGTADESLAEASGNLTPNSWSADGRFIAYSHTEAATPPDIWILPMFGDRKPSPLVQTPFLDTSAMFSPDGRWIAYASSEGDQLNIFVQPFPATGKRYPVSANGGSHPVWRADGKELFYLRADATMMAVPIKATGEFDAGVPQALFRTGAARFNNSQIYAVTKDGKRFLINTRSPHDSAAPLTVVLNWTAAIQK